MFRPVFYLLVCIALWSASVISLSVFSDAPKAHMLLRSRRANSFLEEIKPPSMERECVEEKCDFEEAREIFQTREATLEFWTVYTDGNQCQSHKCDHGACMDLYQTYKCICYPGYEGKYCEYSTSSCGQILIHRSEYSEPVEGLLPWTLGGEVGKKGESPWQVLLLNEKGIFHCGGVLIDENWVLTAAHCLQNTFKFSVRLGDYERFRNEGTEVLLRVTKTFKHPKYNSMTEDNDIALLRLQSPAPLSKYIVPICLPGRSLAEKVLHLNGTTTVVTGWGKDDTGKLSSALNFIKVPLVNHSFCRQQMFPHDLTNNVLCAGILGERIDACEGDSGGPMVTLYRDTWFLIGLVSWGEGCGMVDKLGIYTKVSNYNEWISQVQEEWDRRHHPQ
ncbi:vitamin K-dependent protein C isoform X2 [Cyprinodon tularosa]|uniref:vitamin K-dependent protein C isoform X2 n=1 Tax=Cyprinodon tularosa TaxID=77115 RepID=UPI0018E26727|nr:vitamin K-dependent protein C isoform X2 [Cyprinodon tularosa]